jgi:hypothetical protein
MDHLFLLQYGSMHHFFLNNKLYLDSPGVRLCPKECRINQLETLVDAFDHFEAVSKKLGRLQLKRAPLMRLLESVALSAVV